MKHINSINKNDLTNLIKKKIYETFEEGGTFNIYDRDDNGLYLNNYNYHNDDNNMYLDFSNYGNKLPGNNTWTEVPQDYPINTSKNYEKLKSKSPRDSHPTDDIVLGPNNKYYMPTKKSFGTGDVVRNSNHKRLCTFLKTPYGDIKCYNLSDLGNTNPTILAHYYKGKNMNAGNFNLKGRDMNKLPGGIKSYLKDMIQLVKNIPDLASFNPTYITYPQSSSAFNGQISLLLKKFVYPNATILGGKDLINPETGSADDRALTKHQTWGFSYKGFAQFIQDELKNFKYNSQIIKVDGLCFDIAKEFCGIVKYGLGKSLYNIFNKRGRRPTGLALYKKIETYIDSEYTKLINVLQQENFQYINNNYLSFDFIFLYTIRLFAEQGIVFYVKRNRNGYNVNYSAATSGYIYQSIANFQQAMLNGDITFNPQAIVEKYSQTTSIKDLSKIQRFALVDQFNGSKFLNDKDNSNIKVLIIDDNYATGVSLKNAAIAVYQQGVPIENIICLTPGDMNSSGSGAAGYIGDIPTNAAEAQVYNKYINNFYDANDLTPEDIERLQGLQHSGLGKNLKNGVYQNQTHKKAQEIYNNINLK